MSLAKLGTEKGCRRQGTSAEGAPAFSTTVGALVVLKSSTASITLQWREMEVLLRLVTLLYAPSLVDSLEYQAF